MSDRLMKTKTLAVVLLALLLAAASVPAQDGATLVRQLAGKAEAPDRSPAQLAEACNKAIAYLLPLMAADDVASRYDYQIMLQDMASHAGRPGAEAEREVMAEALIKALDEADMPPIVQGWFVLQLERIGKAESVPALAKLMDSDDEHLADYARRALEKNPDASADDVLLAALAKAETAKMKIGLLNSLGERRVQAALEPVAAALNDADAKVGAAAVTALIGIAGPDSGKAIVGVLNQPTGPITLKAAQALTDIAHELLKQTNYTAAGQVYDFLYRGATGKARDGDDYNPFSIRIAGLNGLAICAPDRLAQVMAEVIQDDDPRVRIAAVSAARLAPTKAPMQILCDMLGDLEPFYQVQVLGLIADRGDLSSIKYAQEALASDDEDVQLAGVEVLTRIGCDASAEILMDRAVKGSDAVQRAAGRGLALMAGPRVDEVIAAQAQSGPTDVRAMALGVLGKRGMPGSAEALLAYAAEGDDDIRSASFRALIDMADQVDIATLADLVAATKVEKVRRSGIAALEAVLGKAVDKDAAAEVVVARMKAADTESKVALLTCLDALGGAVALDAVVDATGSSNDTVKDAAIRTLANWPDYEAAAKLLVIAGDSQMSLTHYVLSMRGALRLIATSEDASLDDRVTLCFKAFDMARRDDEKRQAIAAMASLPSAKAAERLLKLALDETFKNEAGMAAVDMAGRMLRGNRDEARDLAQKVRDLDVSDEVNRRADAIIRGRRR